MEAAAKHLHRNVLVVSLENSTGERASRSDWRSSASLSFQSWGTRSFISEPNRTAWMTDGRGT